MSPDDCSPEFVEQADSRNNGVSLDNAPQKDDSVGTSQEVDMADDTRPTPPGFRFLCCLKFNNNYNATGWALDGSARGFLVNSNLYLGFAIVKFATYAADPSGDTDPGDLKIYGFKPSSILSNMTFSVALISAILMPLVGSIVDHTPLRWKIGVVTAAILVLINGFQIAVMPSLWQALLVMQGAQFLVYTVHNVMQFAYLPELTNNVQIMTKYNAAFNSIQFGSIFANVLFLFGVVMIYTPTVPQLAMISQTVVTVYISFAFGYAWKYCFNQKAPFSSVPKGSNILTVGFKSIYNTARRIAAHEKSLMWLMISIILSEAVLNSFPVIFVTVMSSWIGLNAKEMVTSNLILLACAMPGSAFSVALAKRFNPKVAQQIALSLWVISIVLGSLVIYEPKTPTPYVYVTSLLWGTSYGVIYPCQRTLWTMIVPPGKATEFMGYYVFCGRILEWLPTLTFSIMNELEIPMNYSLMSLSVFFAAAIISISFMGDFDELMARAKTGYVIRVPDEVEATEVGRETLP